ncbi:hypothetical protein [Rhodoferax ferrireducens]|nr:hypothetical protein [Rhodoferax ferrireducens]
MAQTQVRLGLALFESATGVCVGVELLDRGISFGLDQDSILNHVFQGDAMAQVLPLAQAKDLFLVSHPDRILSSKGRSIGNYQGRVIPAWIQLAGGQRYEFAGICGPTGRNCLHQVGQVVISPGMIYEAIEHTP